MGGDRVLLILFMALAFLGVACGDDSRTPTAAQVDGDDVDHPDESADVPESVWEDEEPAQTETTTTTTAPEVERPALDASPYLATFGDLDDLSLAVDRGGELLVVAQGPLTPQQTVPVLVRNGTIGDVVDITLYHEDQDDLHLEDYEGSDPHLEARVTGEGRLLPYIVPPGEIAFGYVYMDDDYSDAENPGELDFRADHYDNPWSLGVPVAVSEANLSGSRFTLTLTNQNERPVIDLVMLIICIDTNGIPFGHPTFDDPQAFLDQRLEPGQTGAFTLDLSNLPDGCNQGLAAAVGNRTL